jgi:predicted transposase YbfD/YdcC
LFGKQNVNFLKQFLELKNGIPSHDTINRIFQAINPRTFERYFINWVNNVKDRGVLENVVAIDGKEARGSRDSFHHNSAAHMVHAWSVAQGLCLGQYRCKVKSNEITAIPELIDMLDIQGCIVTIDAMGTQVDITRKIIDNKADYILAVKDNQKTLAQEVHAACNNGKCVSDTTTYDKTGGRVETRRCEVFESRLFVDDRNRWANLQTVVKITATTETPKKTTVQERFYISSLNSTNDFNSLIRSHWEVENRLHWVLDVVFREDEQRKRAKHAAENFAIVRKIALNLLRKDTDKKTSLRSKRLKAAWNKDYLLSLLKI